MTEHDPYIGAIEGFRHDKDRFFATSPDSPIDPTERSAFGGLAYFPVDPTARIAGLTLEPYTGAAPERFAIPTSDGDLRPARRAGSFSFEIHGTPCRLVAYVLADGDPGALFVPFLDATSGVETYGAGRYLDLEPEPDGRYVLDLNLAYSPYCAYSPDYSCPLTPEENRLPVRVEAGERLSQRDPGH